MKVDINEIRDILSVLFMPVSLCICDVPKLSNDVWHAKQYTRCSNCKQWIAHRRIIMGEFKD